MCNICVYMGGGGGGIGGGRYMCVYIYVCIYVYLGGKLGGGDVWVYICIFVGYIYVYIERETKQAVPMWTTTS